MEPDQDTHQHVEIREGDRAVAFADVATPPGGNQPVRASLHAEAGHLPPGSRSRLVDAVLDLPDVRGAEHLVATMPLGDSESLRRLQDQCEDVTTRAAGSTVVVEGHPAPGPHPS